MINKENMRKKPELVLVPEDHSFSIHSEEELLGTFNDKDQDRVLLPPGQTYPVHAQHYLAWRESSGNYTYMVFKRPEWKKPMGLVFKRPTSGAELTGARHCDWCLSYGSSDQVSMMGLKLNSRQSIGIMLCTDLNCATRLETVADLSGKSFEKLIGQLYERIGKLYDSVMRSQSRDDGAMLGDV